AILGAATLRRRPACAAALVAPAALALPVYLIWNRTAFGVWLPVSGMVKSEWAASAPLARRVSALLDVPWVGQELLLRVFHQPALFGGSPAVPVLAALLLAGV